MCEYPRKTGDFVESNEGSKIDFYNGYNKIKL